MIFALVGNQNCGKTTLFNALTGSNQHVGNFPGVTVDQKMGEMRDEKGCSVVDLPGIYSLRPYTQEEIVSRDFIINEKPDGIINIVDATNIERNLYLTLQLLELRVPMVLALNMMDEVRANGGAIDVQKMSDALGIPVVPISAAKGEGVSELVDQALSVARSRTLPKVTDFCSDDSAVHRCIHAVVHIIADHADRIGVPARFCAAKLIEGGDDLAQVLDLDENERELLEHCIVQMENETGLDRNAALADMRYTFIETVVASSVVKCHESKEHARSMKIDRILTGKYTAMPTFLLVMLLTFYLTFNVIGKWLSDLLQLGIDALTGVVDAALTAYGINPVVHSLIIDGVFAGVGSVLVFLQTVRHTWHIDTTAFPPGIVNLSIGFRTSCMASMRPSSHATVSGSSGATLSLPDCPVASSASTDISRERMRFRSPTDDANAASPRMLSASRAMKAASSSTVP